jgi:hypothetical protein
MSAWRASTPTEARAIAWALAGYVAVGAVMLAPITSYRHLDSALYGGDTRLNAWALAWVDHAVLGRIPVFEANIFFPALNTLAYSEHLLGISPFALPVYALTRNAALSYNIVWLLSYLACALAAYALAWRVTHDRFASWSAGWHTRSVSTACSMGTLICSCCGLAGFLSRSSSSNDGGVRRRGRVSCRCGWSCWCRC